MCVKRCLEQPLRGCVASPSHIFLVYYIISRICIWPKVVGVRSQNVRTRESFCNVAPLAPWTKLWCNEEGRKVPRRVPGEDPGIRIPGLSRGVEDCIVRGVDTPAFQPILTSGNPVVCARRGFTDLTSPGLGQKREIQGWVGSLTSEPTFRWGF